MPVGCLSFATVLCLLNPWNGYQFDVRGESISFSCNAAVLDNTAYWFCKYWQMTGAKLFIFPECCPQSTERVIQVTGKRVNVANTVGTVLDLILPVCCCILSTLQQFSLTL